MKSHRHARRHTINQLLVGADWACAHGDAGGLGEVARELADRGPEWMRRALDAVRDAVAADSDPFACWACVRPAVVEYFHDLADDEREPDRVHDH